MTIETERLIKLTRLNHLKEMYKFMQPHDGNMIKGKDVHFLISLGFSALATPVSPSTDAPAPEAPTINGEAPNARNLLAALIDIYDDAQNAPPEHRCYVPEAWPDILKEARQFLAAPIDASAAPACQKCGGTRVVDDGEIDCYEDGTPYRNGPVKCVKDCPACNGKGAAGREQEGSTTGAERPAPAGQAVGEREAFERHIQATKQSKPLLWSTVFANSINSNPMPAHLEGVYFIRDDQKAWLAWQARATLAASQADPVVQAVEPAPEKEKP